MVKCSVCGGEADSVGANKYRCRYCMHEFSEEECKVEKRAYVQKRSNEGVDVFEQNINGVLEITCTNNIVMFSGSGLLIDKSGYAITNAHVVTHEGKPLNNIDVKLAGEIVRAKIIALGDDKGGSGDGVDLALLKLERVPYKAVVIKLADFNKVRIGEQVFVIGNSLGDGNCITSGIVSDKKRYLSKKTPLLMTDCAINDGNSGGPIFNGNGEAIGVIVSSRIQDDGSATEGMNYAIPADIVVDFIKNNTDRHKTIFSHVF